MNVEQIVRGLGLVAAAALIGWGLAGGGLSSADRCKLSETTTATNQIADRYSNSVNSNPNKIAGVLGTGFYTVAQVPIKDIQLGSRVPAHNPEVITDQRRQFQEPRWDRWMKLSVQMTKADGSLLEIELLRSEDWVIEQLIIQTQAPRTECFWRLEDESTSAHEDSDSSAVVDATDHQPADAAAFCEETIDGPTDHREKRDVVGIPASFVPLRPVYAHLLDTVTDAWLSGDFVGDLSVYLHLPELGISGLGRLVDLKPAPFVRPGPGQVVTATFKHASANVLDLVLTSTAPKSNTTSICTKPSSHSAINTPSSAPSASSTELSDPPIDTIGVTANHPFWSVDHAEFRPAGELKIGERLQTLAGDTVWLQQKLPRAGPEPVYNLEVHNEHVYYVGTNSVLVHNSYPFINQFEEVVDLGQQAVKYRNQLSEVAGRLNLATNRIPKANIAVIEYIDELGDLRTITRISGKAGHAEKRAIDAIKRSMGDKFTRDTITRIYSDLSPCQAGGCVDLILANTSGRLKLGWLTSLKGKAKGTPWPF